MKAEGKITKAEGLLLGLTALFLCGLLILARQDRLAAPLAAEPEHSVPAEEVTPVTDLNTAHRNSWKHCRESERNWPAGLWITGRSTAGFPAWRSYWKSRELERES